MGRCGCGNMIQLDLDLDAAVHPTTGKAGDGNVGAFSPDISETQKAVASPRNTHVHTKGEKDKADNTCTVFERLYKDKERRERRLKIERIRIKKEDEKELTFHPQTNVKHGKRKTAPSKTTSPKRSGEKKKAQCQNCLEASLGKQGKGAVESAAELLEKDLRFEEENEDEDINGPLLEAGGTYATLAAQPQ